MNKDLLLFQKIIERLIFLTTRDEYGSCRSRGISNYEELSDDLNQTGIVPTTKCWNKNSLALFFCRLHKRYSEAELCSICDLEFIGRQSWEYQSCTKHEDVCDRRNTGHTYFADTRPTKRAKPTGKPENKIESWKEHEIPEVSHQDKKMENILKSLKSKRQFVN